MHINILYAMADNVMFHVTTSWQNSNELLLNSISQIHYSDPTKIAINILIYSAIDY